MPRHLHHRSALISLLLLVLVARALVPVGFMPAGDGSAQLILCPDGMLMPSGHSHIDHCPFGSAPFAAPISSLAVIPTGALPVDIPGTDPSPWVPSARIARTHQPRAPPA